MIGCMDKPIRGWDIKEEHRLSQINMATTSTSNSEKNEQNVQAEVKSKISIYQQAIYSRQLDGLILVNFFLFFVVSFIAGLLFLYSSLSLWTFQVCEDGDLYQTITFAAQSRNDLISVVTYNASAPLSLNT